MNDDEDEVKLGKAFYLTSINKSQTNQAQKLSEIRIAVVSIIVIYGFDGETKLRLAVILFLVESL